ncbi:ABC transporter permease [Methylomonas sp. SURF-2]|uniref:ABC transporter permease n=1 Tax=Methylomonas subterranea TaxID=2952225 RepID=A0ABT1TH41_9GAMM|nr:ABC transporter permease [Methylomonas sp. SURF-2]MCQ8104782.1 ABC transporter permease [Methylomonas sp. SURF-2]
MHTLWHKVRADLWLGKSRSVLAVISIAAGVFCVGTLFGMIDLQLGRMDSAHRQSQPSHISMILRSDADNSLLGKIAALPGVLAVEGMTPVTVRFRPVGEAEWQLATLMIRPDYTAQRFDKTLLQAGQWPAAGGVAIENLSARASGIGLEARIEFETVTGNHQLTLQGVVRHPFIKPPKFGGQMHFFADTGDAKWFGVPEHSFRQLLVRIRPPFRAEQARAVALDIRQLLIERGIAVNATLLQDPDRHWGRPFMAGVNGVLKLMALVSLLLASVLILNTVAAHITQQTDQIGVMKALGAKRLSIAKLYLVETLLLAVCAVALAAPCGLAAAYLSSCRLLGLFNIECGGFSYSGKAVLLMTVGGVLVPMFAALGPILRGANMNVREALASYGLRADFGGSRFDVWLDRVGARYLSTLNAAALGNLFRRKGRLLLTQSVLIIAGAMFLVLMSLIASLHLTLDNEMARSRYSVRLGFSGEQEQSRVTAIANAVSGTQKIEFWQRYPLEISHEGKALQQKGSLGLQLLALPVAGELYQPLIESGRWFTQADAGRRVMLISADTAAMNGLRAGDQVGVGLGPLRQSWQIIGIYRWLAGSDYAIEPVYAPVETLRALTDRQDAVSFALLDADKSSLTEEADYLAALKQRFQDNGIPLDVYGTVAKLRQRQFAANQFKPVIGMLLGLACMIAVVGGIGLSGALAISVLQRTREIGVLRAIGASGGVISRLFVLEGLLHGMVAWLLSLPLAYFAARPVADSLGETMLGLKLDFSFDAWAVGYWLLIVLPLAAVAAYWPARAAANMSIRDCLGH